jgi:predicted aspartyl protease
VEEEEVSGIYTLGGKAGLEVTLKIAGTEVPMQVDTGATVAVIPTSMYQTYLSHVQLSPSQIRLQTYTVGSR